MKRYILLLATLCLTVVAQAQTSKTLSGCIVDENGNAIESAVVSWLALPDSTLIVNGISDVTGHFSLVAPKALPDSTVLVLSCIGYARKVVPIEGNNGGEQRIVLAEISHHLEGVTVTAKSTMKGLPGGYAFTPGGTDLLLPDGNELLKNVPMLSGQFGSYTLLGKKDAKVYINGRDPYMDASMIHDLLSAVKPSDIERVELIFNPGSKQSASDDSGIVNIILKRRPDFGFNGSVYLMGIEKNNRIITNDYLNLNYSHGKFRFLTSLGLELTNRYGKYESEYNYFDTNTTSSNLMVSKVRTWAPSVGLLASYELTQKSTIGARVNEKMKVSKNSDFTQSKTVDATSAITEITSDRICRTPFGTETNATLFYYYRTDKRGGGLDVSLNYSNSQSPTRDTMTYVGAEQIAGAYVPFLQNTESTINAWQADAKYQHNFSDGSSLSFGAQWNFSRTDRDYLRAEKTNGVFVRDDGQSNRFVYDETVSAVFVSYEREWNKMLDTSVGLRGEHTHVKGDLRTTGEVFKNNYFRLMPNASMNLNMAEGKHIVGLDYSTRLFRPFYSILNPFKVWISSNTYKMGNPDLLADYTHDLQLRYTLLGKYTLMVDGSWSPHLFADFTTSDGQNNTVISYRTFGRSQLYGMRLSGRQSFLKGRLRMSAEFGAHYFDYKGTLQEVQNSNHGWQFSCEESVSGYLDRNFTSGVSVAHSWSGRHTEPARVDDPQHYLSFSAWKVFKWNGQLQLQFSTVLPSECGKSFDMTGYHYVSRMRNSQSMVSIAYYQTFGKSRVKNARAHAGNSFSNRMK